MLEDLEPDVHFELLKDLKNTGKLQTLNGCSVETNMTLDSDGGAIANSASTNVLITDWNIPYRLFITQRTYQGVTYPKTDMTVMCRLKINRDELVSWLGNSVLQREGNGCVLGTMDANEFFGLVCYREEGETGGVYDSLIIKLGGRNSSTRKFVDMDKLQWDTWTHLAFTYRVSDNHVDCYVNGALVGSDTMPVCGNWEWRLRTASWVILTGNYHAENYPFYYKDIRIYNHLISREGIKHLYSH